MQTQNLIALRGIIGTAISKSTTMFEMYGEKELFDCKSCNKYACAPCHLNGYCDSWCRQSDNDIQRQLIKRVLPIFSDKTIHVIMNYAKGYILYCNEYQGKQIFVINEAWFEWEEDAYGDKHRWYDSDKEVLRIYKAEGGAIIYNGLKHFVKHVLINHGMIMQREMLWIAISGC